MPTLKFIRENPEAYLENVKKRHNPEKTRLAAETIALDGKWRILLKELDGVRAEKNILTREITAAKSAGKGTKALLEKAKKLPAREKGLEAETKKAKESLDGLVQLLPNMLDDSVPFGKDDSENVQVGKWGKTGKREFPLEHHGKLAAELGCADFERAVKISGSGFFFLMGDLARLEMALEFYALEKLSSKGFIIVQPPLMMNRIPYAGVTDLSAFEDVLYKIEGQDQFMIATSEHPLVGMFMGDIIDGENLPVKLAGVSSCFRKEIGKHGLDERGLFRVHQFNKIEQVVFCRPDNSRKEHELLARNSEELLEDLEIPYEKVNVCTGDIGEVASKKYDINGWSPREGKYIELMSCSNCTDYQSSRLGIKFRLKGSMEKELVHTLNNTMVATARALRVIIEIYQTENRTIIVPKALRKFMGGTAEIMPQKRF